MNDTMLELRPLSSYFWGNLRLMMRSGRHLLRVDEETAHKLRNSFEHGEPADAVHEGSFLALETDALDAMQWIADSRQPGKETAQDRQLRRLGGALFEGGWLQALRDVAPADASYSVAGLVAWKAAALLLLQEQQDLSEESREAVLRILASTWDGVADPTESTPGRTYQRSTAPAAPSTKQAGDDVAGPGSQVGTEPEPVPGAETGAAAMPEKDQVEEERPVNTEADNDESQDSDGPAGSGDAP